MVGTGHGPIILITARERFCSLKITPLKALAPWRPLGGVIGQRVEDMSPDITTFRTPLLEVMAQKAVRTAASDAIKSITTPFTGQSAMLVATIVLAAPSGTTTLF